MDAGNWIFAETLLFKNWYPNASLANSADDSQPRVTCEGRTPGRAQRAENYYLDRLTRYLYKMARILPCVADEARARGHGYIVRSLIRSFEINVITPDCFIRVARASSFPRAIFGNICAAAFANGSESCLWYVCRILTYVCRNIAADTGVYHALIKYIVRHNIIKVERGAFGREDRLFFYKLNIEIPLFYFVCTSNMNFILIACYSKRTYINCQRI